MLLLSATVSAQQPTSFEDPQMDVYFSNPANVPSIKGKLHNFNAGDWDSLSIRYVLVVPSPERQSMRQTDFKKDGSFEIKLDYAIPYQQVFLMLPFCFSEIIVKDGVFIEGDLQEMREYALSRKAQGETPNAGKKLNYSGPDGAMNQMKSLYNDFEPQAKEQFYKLQNEASNWKMPKAERSKLWDEATALVQAHQIRFLEQHPFQEGWILENERKSEYYGYQFVINWQSGLPGGDTLRAALEHEPHLLSNDGRAYYSYLYNLLSINHKMDVLAGLAEVNLPTRKADLLKLIGGPEGLYEREEYLKKIMPTLQTDWCKKVLQEELDKKQKETQSINATLQNLPAQPQKTTLGQFVGALPSGAQLYQAEGQSIDSLVQRIRSLYPQQAVILDIWATWCGPCISDMRDSKPVKEQLKNLPVKIFYLCVDNSSTKEKWQQKVAELGVDGDHIWLTGSLSLQIMEKYGLAGYPSYIFIDAQGKYHPKFIRNIAGLDIEALKKKL